MTDLALAISKLELFATKADIIIHKALMKNAFHYSTSIPLREASAVKEPLAQTYKAAQSPNQVSQIADTLPAEKIHRGPRVRRQEQVFSGRRLQRRGSNHSSYNDYQASNPRQSAAPSSSSGFSETMKRLFLGGALTAAFCYLVGLTTEILRGKLEPPKASKRAGMYSTEDAR